MGLLVVPGTASALDYAPVDTPGPPLSVPQAKLDASLVCSPGVDAAARAPVLLVPGTGATPKENWDWTYVRAFDMVGIPWCTLEVPEHSNGDIQVAGEYIVNGIRTMFQRAGRKIAVAGHSQGGMSPRWALRFWPDTRAMVDDQIGFAASNHGTTLAAAACNSSCSAASWQQRNSSEFIKAINSIQETFPGISYSMIYTRTDEVVLPNSDDNGSSSLHGGGGDIENVATQEVCPTAVYEHFAIGTIDPVAYALAIDALNNPGPAVPARISPLVCAQVLQPGVNPVTFPTDAVTAFLAVENSPSTPLPAEPPLACYVFAGGCPASAVGTADGQSPYGPAKSKCRKKKKRKHGKQKRKRCGKKKKKKGKKRR